MTGTEKTSKTVNVTDDSFSDDVLSSSTPVLVDFWATWCGPCKMVAPVLEEIAGEKAGALTVAKLDVDANPATARDFQVVSIPTMILFKDGAAGEADRRRQGQGRAAARALRRRLTPWPSPAATRLAFSRIGPASEIILPSLSCNRQRWTAADIRDRKAQLCRVCVAVTAGVRSPRSGRHWRRWGWWTARMRT